MSDLQRTAGDYEIHVAARAFEDHLAAKDNPLAEKYLQRLPSKLQAMVKSMPEKDMDKNEAYNDRKVLGLAKKLKGVPHKQLEQIYQVLHRAFLDAAGDFHTIPDEQRDDLRRIVSQLQSAWRASNEAIQTVGEDRKEREQKNQGMGRYLPRAELKKRRKIDYQLVKDLDGWDSAKPNDPIYKVILQAKKDGYYVRFELMEKALKHLQQLIADPNNADDTAELETLYRQLDDARHGRGKTAFGRPSFESDPRSLWWSAQVAPIDGVSLEGAIGALKGAGQMVQHPTMQTMKAFKNTHLPLYEPIEPEVSVERGIILVTAGIKFRSALTDEQWAQATEIVRDLGLD